MKKREVGRGKEEVFAGQVDKEPETCFPLYLFRPHNALPEKDAAAIRARTKQRINLTGFQSPLGFL
ncbi:hypothetical protein QE422_000176 [Chryseobacterium sp. SORGH_AS 447]|uniref:hypothetical protein n=1 Tax=Chryseobacterium sp. SORGH_AS_0447 TaxID=3041769 RepID=UPI0027837E42|nr:hypothetical protein [Chryseobacterium sp. SORGH_AS_0447]MDQ1159808.1 hypothetical protein [Chryseobacterium sp. SORGH_AS_0447]